MPRIILIALLFAPSTFAPYASLAQQPSQEKPTGIAFEAAKGTGLAEILASRRRVLEERQGKPLTGHQWWLWGLGSFDYDRDGDGDLIVCIHGSNNGLILRNELKETGKLTFVDATETLGVDGLVPSTDNYPLMWDFDGDGYVDIAGLLNDTQTPCLLNRGGKGFVKAAFSLHPINYPSEIRDLNGDGYIDIAQTQRDKRIERQYDAKSASFIKRESDSQPPAELPASLTAELEKLHGEKNNRFLKVSYFQRDLNGDGRVDCVVRAFGSYDGDRLGWYLVAGANGKLEDRTKELGVPRDGAPLLVEDLDHDGDVDVLIASAEQAGLYLNDGKDKFSAQPGPLTDFVKQRCPYLHVAMRVDLDYDGDLDLAVSNRRYGRQMVFESLGRGEFTPVLKVPGWDADPLVLRDINNDGLIDVIVGGAGGKEDIGVFLNSTAKIGNYCRIHPRLKRPNIYAAGTRVELFRDGTLGKPDAYPILAEDAHLDGSPIYLGLGAATSFDLRVSFPGHEPLELKNVKAKHTLFVTPDGVSTAEPN